METLIKYIERTSAAEAVPFHKATLIRASPV